MRSEGEIFLETLLQSAIDYAILTTDLDGRITSWNAGAEKLLGWTGAEICGQIGTILFTEEDRRPAIPEL